MLRNNPKKQARMVVVKIPARKPVRVWTRPIGADRLYPTSEFYKKRMVMFSNEGTPEVPLWIPLDANNENVVLKRWKLNELVPILNKIRRNGELSYARKHPFAI